VQARKLRRPAELQEHRGVSREGHPAPATNRLRFILNRLRGLSRLLAQIWHTAGTKRDKRKQRETDKRLIFLAPCRVGLY